MRVISYKTTKRTVTRRYH